ncbi:MAG: hypothetical protein EOO45_10745 [Flavobacterium sp.]|nr:MAG: hypothetical protein EOO45_10745 [Flavobacterium sp.]
MAGLCILISGAAMSQENNSSPYSYYGIGDTKFKGTVENRSMGGLSIQPDSIHINLQNPASYSHLKFTTFTVGGTNSITNFKTANDSDKAGRVSLDYLALAVPLNKFGFAFGLMPYTAVGYKIQNTTTGADDLQRSRQFEGTGGLNRVFAGASYRITPKFSAGVDFQYNFGNIETKSIVGIPRAEIQYPVREVNKSDYNGISFAIGAVYQAKLNQKLDWFTSATFTPQSTLRSSIERQTSTITLVGTRETIIDVIDSGRSDERLKLPTKVTFGSGVGLARKWFAGAEYTFIESNELGNRFDAITTAGFEASHKMTLGGYYIPNYSSFNSYLSRVTYRAGLKFEKTGLVINNESISDYGFSLGLGLPLGGNIGGSNLNLGMEMGRRGTTRANLIQENYINIFVSLSLSDKWFIKRKYD